ncbi:jockey\pol [Symbiodinium sp. CCMP2592]|nr:jockey\pol [Symbiodinium sp. CCMP2592]
MAQHQQAVPVLLGDMNLPTFLSPNPSPGLAASESALNCLFHSSFVLQLGGVVLNPPAQPTHIRGNILDLAVVFDCHRAFSCTVIPQRFANSDHFPIFVSSSLRIRPESTTLKWCTFRDFPVQAFVAEISPSLAVLHSWMAHQLQPVPQEECILKDILIQGSVTFGLLLLAVLYQTNSPYGRFACNNRRGRRRGFMSSALRKAITSMRNARGSARFSILRRKVDSLMRRCRRRRVYLSAFRITSHGLVRPTNDLHQWLKDDLKPGSSASRFISIGNNVLEDQVATDLWVEFLRSQTSWDGQLSPDVLLQLYDGHLSEAPKLPAMPAHTQEDHSDCKQWLRSLRCQPLSYRAKALVQWTEFCDAVEFMNGAAAPPPSEPIPVSILSVPCEPLRACWIGLLNLVILCDHLPRIWATVVVAPLLKPGKARNRLESHRPISLMPLGLKLLDRVLFCRVWPVIQDQALPWQLGGSKGPDLCIAFMGDLLRLRFKQKAPWTVIFLDGQSAFCRPPWLAVVSGMRRIPGISDMDILIIFTLLSGIRSKVAVFGSMHGNYKNEVGLPQGGALSTALFVLLTFSLYGALCDADTACLASGNSCMFSAPACGYVDDIALLTSAPAAAQPALKVAFEWAQGIRMVFNVGVDKSACLVSYDGSAPTADMKFPDGQALPVVDEYRYLGALLTATGRVGRSIQDLEERILQKTGPLIGWARANQIPLSHLGKLWKLYVEPGIWWLVAALPITHAQADRLDLLQRKVARMLLGHGKRSPLPSALACLGWVPWSHLLACARMSLLARACADSCNLMAQLFPIAVTVPGTWAEQVSADVLHAFGIEAPHAFTASKAELKDFHSSSVQIGWQQLVEQCVVHPNLTHFPIECFRGCEIPNPIAAIFEAPSIGLEQSTLALRLFCGGQGLRAGDVEFVSADSRNCCLFCLGNGSQVAETLHHFLLQCPLTSYAHANLSTSLVQQITAPHTWMNLRASEKKLLVQVVCRKWLIRKSWLHDNLLHKRSTRDALLSRLWP